MYESLGEEPEFREVQQFRQPWLLIPLAVVGVAVTAILVYGMIQQFVLGEPWGDEPMSDTALAIVGPLVILLLLVAAWLLSKAKLVTEVRPDGLHIQFRCLLVNRIFPFADIASCQARKYDPILEYGGWGVRWGLTSGKAYNVRGNRGVQLVLAGGKRLLIGSQRADELAAAIRRHLPQNGQT